MTLDNAGQYEAWDSIHHRRVIDAPGYTEADYSRTNCVRQLPYPALRDGSY
jgi:hypothetical protein